MLWPSILISVTFHLVHWVGATSTGHSDVLRSLDGEPVIHFTITRRLGAFAANEGGESWVDLDYLVKQLDKAESAFNLTSRVVKGNKLVRNARTSGTGGKQRTELMGNIASDGAWYDFNPF